MSIKDKKDAFLIIRISHFDKDSLLNLAVKGKIKLSTLVRTIIETHLNGN